MIEEIIFLIFAVAIGYLISQIRNKRKLNKTFSSKNIIPIVLPKLVDVEKNIIELYLKEWEVTINTQMHFNDLIIRFRSITLTGFIALIGTAVTLQKLSSITDSDFKLIISIIGIFWFTAFILDFFYYHRLLLGSVAHAMKFDESKTLNNLGLFGLSTLISDKVHPPASKLFVIIYYLVPATCVSILLYFKLI